MTAPTPVTVALVNDYEVVVRGVHAMLAPFEDRVEVVELGTVDTQHPAQVTLYDTFAASQLDGVGLDTLLRDEASALVVYSWNLEPDLVEVALAKGCRGYLDKSMSADDLVVALERVADGEVVVTPHHERADEAVAPTGRDEAELPAAQARQVGQVSPASGDWPGRTEGLSAREAEVIALITQGLTNQDIADQTYLSINSIKTYIRTAYRKMGVTRRSQAVRWGLEHGMLPAGMRDGDPG